MEQQVPVLTGVGLQCGAVGFLHGRGAGRGARSTCSCAEEHLLPRWDAASSELALSVVVTRVHELSAQEQLLWVSSL
ncbi:hypothetical protein FQA47_023298 [Oryzias melastigma]|uniref:Uncharacterized protein n=1 Tax=Oryzias melastigma TaxID=30732 RepID=A0A834CHN2_ORYME|nr:hypothetical protein FQA47_023298 [Oryzias melastigma]